MSSFIREVAQTLLKRYGNDLSNLVVIFPSTRARVFFNDALTELIDTPMWQPSWSSIDELMEQGSGLKRGERIRLIAELFKIYKKHHPSEEFDRFYFWGDMLISDFDMIDKYLIEADADKLLRNIWDIKVIESDLSYLTPEQESIVRFWRSVDSDGATLTEQKQRFLEIWRTLPAIYKEYREHLSNMGIGYPGMIYRTTTERIKDANKECDVDFGNKRFVFVGFNALSESEKVLFDYLAKSPQGAEFYWDYDNYYVENKDHEAGLFIRNNLSQFPATEVLSHNNFYDIKKKFTSTACVSNIVQIKHVADIISSIPEEELNKQTAIVLTDENMLIPLLHSLPADKVKKVNVTMGYPIKTTLAYTFMERIITLQAKCRTKGDTTQFYHVDVTGLLSHPYITDIFPREAKQLTADIVANKAIMIDAEMFKGREIIGDIFACKIESTDELSTHLINVMGQVYNRLTDVTQREYIRIIKDEIENVVKSIKKCDLKIPLKVFISLLRRHIQTLTIPYEGKPVEGLQIMGILETRNIDFKNVIILSMTDATFPGDRTDTSSFVPYGLRIAYGMPTHVEHEAMYAYYFYRLIQRAERVEMLYCSRADKMSTGERSRYIYQLEYESKYKIQKRSVGVDLGANTTKPITIEKDAEVMKSLNRFIDPNQTASLSPSSFYKYVRCPLSFYLSSVAHLKTPDELEDNIDALTLGNILHETMENLYKKILRIDTPTAQIKAMSDKKTVEEEVDRAIRKLLKYGDNDTESDFTGDTLLVRDLITNYIQKGILEYDSNRTGFAVTELEDEDIKMDYPLSDGRTVRLSGRADRIDTLADGKIQVVDYKSSKKTSKPHLEFNGVDGLFNGDKEAKKDNVFQILFYAMLLHHKYNKDVVPALYYASEMMVNKDYSAVPYTIKGEKKEKVVEAVESYEMVKDEYETLLTQALEELFDPKKEFCQTDDAEICTYCDFKKICRR